MKGRLGKPHPSRCRDNPNERAIQMIPQLTDGKASKYGPNQLTVRGERNLKLCFFWSQKENEVYHVDPGEIRNSP